MSHSSLFIKSLTSRADDSVFSKLPNNDLKLNYGDGTGVNVHFKGFEE